MKRYTGMEEQDFIDLLDSWLMELPDEMDGDDAFEAILARICARFDADDETELIFAEFLQSVW